MLFRDYGCESMPADEAQRRILGCVPLPLFSKLFAMAESSSMMNPLTSEPFLTNGSSLPICPSQIDTENSAHWHSLVHARFGVVSSLYVALRAKHPPAAAHSLRVTFWTSAWGLRHGLREEQLQLFEMLALLHEIGKIGIPDRVLQKPEKLNSQEQSMMDMHTQVGLEILRSAGASKDLLIALAGLGTSFESSSNLHSTEIAPVASRLVNIIDAYDSMTAKQVYREALTREMALAELIRLGGTQFDPKLVRSFTEMMLSNDRALQARVAERWINRIEPHDFARFFDSDRETRNDRLGSSLVHALNESFYRHMMDHIQNGVIFVDSEYRVLDWNLAVERMTGRSAQSVLHQYWTPQIAALCDSDGYNLDDSLCPFRRLMTMGNTEKQRLSLRGADSKLLHVEVEVVPVISDKGDVCGGAMIIEDISETAELERKIVHLRERACQDQLTKVANRGELNRQLPEFLSYHQRNKQPGSIIICDIDYFKRINDNFSHQAGDQALIAFANLLKSSCRETDFVARYGGEEFVLLCGQCDQNEAKSLAESLRTKLHRTPIPALRNQVMTASFGVACIQPEDTEESVLGRADKGLLIAKESGRDRVVCLGDKPPQEETSQPPKNKGWLQWLYPSSDCTLKCELVTNVPREVTLEKLKGFVKEFHANVQHVDLDSAVLDLDCKNTPIPKRSDERLGKFRMSIQVADIEMKTGGRKEQLKVCTLLNITISAFRNRDRREDSLRSQAVRLKTALQGFLVAHEMDDELREDFVRKIKRETGSRY
jgi:diguanylate cyclase (GGDEF)-like protein/PAS domain S-box-containing protein